MFLSVLPLGPSVACLDENAPDEGACVRPANQHSTQILPINGLFADLDAERDEVRGVIDFTETLCPDGECPLIIDDVVVRYDGVHYTGTQSLRMAPLIDERLRALGIDLAAL